MNPDLVRDFYKRELDEKSTLDSRLGIYAALLTAVAGIMSIGRTTVIEAPAWLDWLTALGLAAACVAYARSLLLILRFTTGNKYQRIPIARLLEGHHRSLEEWYEANPLADGDVDSAFTSDLNQRMIEAASIIAYANTARGELHVQILRSLSLSVVCAGLPILVLATRNVILDLFSTP